MRVSGLRTVLGVSLIVLSWQAAFGCSLGSGYFYQMTQLKGRVVGKTLGPLQYFRFLRQSFSVPNAQLTLYEFKQREDRQNLNELATVKADRDGQFDFGGVPTGHYTLAVDSDKYSQWFDVEITPAVKQTESVLIDVSPYFPDCEGGHELIVRSKT